MESLDQKKPNPGDFAQRQRELESKRKKLLAKKERYQELYASELITLSELKEKLASIAEALKKLDTDLGEITRSSINPHQANHALHLYAEAIHRFLNLDTITNADMRQILDHISVNQDGTVRVVLKKYKNTEDL